MSCEDIFHVLIDNFFSVFSKSYSRAKFVTIWSGDIGGRGSTRLVTNGDNGGGGAKIINFAVTSFLNGP